MDDKENKKIDEMEAEAQDNEEGQLAIDVYETPEAIVIESAVAGVCPHDLDVVITEEMVTIKGERHREEGDKKVYSCEEIFWGKFSRSIVLEKEVDIEKAGTAFKNGILKITMPKFNRSRMKKLKVE